MAALESSSDRHRGASRRCAARASAGRRVRACRRLDRAWSALARDLRRPAADPQPDRHGHAGQARAAQRRALAGHRPARPRRALAPDLRRAHLADGRPAGAGDRRHDRRRARHAGGLLPRPPGDLRRSAASTCCWPSRRWCSRSPSPPISASRSLNITLVIGVLGIPAFTRVARAVTLVAQRARVRHGRTRARRHPQPHPAARAAAQRRAAAGRLLPAGRGGHHRRRGRAELPRPRRAAAGAELGQHDRRGPREPRHRAVARLPAGGGSCS